MGETLKLTNGRLQQMHAALKILGNRKMANLGSELKVARLLRALAQYVEPLEIVKRRATLELLGDPQEETKRTLLQEQVLTLRIVECQAGLDSQEAEVELPLSCALKEADLPKELSGADGWKNASQLGALIADLGPLYTDAS